MFCYNYLSFHLTSKSVFIQGMTDERRKTETRFVMNDYVYEFTRKRKRHMLFRRCFYGSLILIALLLAVGILQYSHHHDYPFVAAVFGIWILLTLYFCYKIYLTRMYHGGFQKGYLKVGELDDLDGLAFEELACEILLANGFDSVENTKASGDFGVDILASKEGMTYAVQCKCYHDKVGLEAVQEVYAGRDYYECHVAVVLTNQTFTPAAIKLADKIGVVLWDRNTLRDLL